MARRKSPRTLAAEIKRDAVVKKLLAQIQRGDLEAVVPLLDRFEETGLTGTLNAVRKLYERCVRLLRFDATYDFSRDKYWVRWHRQSMRLHRLQTRIGSMFFVSVKRIDWQDAAMRKLWEKNLAFIEYVTADLKTEQAVV